MKECIICGNKIRTLDDPQMKVTYSVCEKCGFVYKDKAFHVSHDDEKKEYNQHNNSFESTGYVNMFVRFIEDHIKPLKVTGNVLEFGSGPGPVLKELLIREGFNVSDFDPYYNNNDEY